jgi:hypothetical protein
LGVGRVNNKHILLRFRVREGQQEFRGRGLSVYDLAPNAELSNKLNDLSNDSVAYLTKTVFLSKKYFTAGSCTVLLASFPTAHTKRQARDNKKLNT